MEVLCLLLPASISILISEKLRKEKRNLSELVMPYLGYTFMINLIMTIIYHFIHTGKIDWYTSKLFTFDFTMQYMLISFAVAIAISCLMFIVSKVVQINISVRNKKRNGKENFKNFNQDYKRKH